jgi:hypothetical protein
MWYGLGCQLEGKDPSPYRGFKLWERANVRGRHKSRSFFKRVPQDGDLNKKLRVKTKPEWFVSVGHPQDNERTPENV